MNVAVLGAGYAGLALARSLEDRLNPGDDLVVVDERDTHLIQHRLHRVIRDPTLAADLEVPLAAVLDRATHRQARVESVDADAGTATLDDGDLSWDVGAVSLGARTNFHGLPGLETHGQPLKRLEHANNLYTDLQDLLAAGGGRVVVGGAGLSGIQVAGEIAALASAEGATDALTVHLVEQADRVAPQFPERFRSVVDSELRERGVFVETDRTVERATDDALVLSDATERDYDVFVWTGGITAPEAVGDDRPSVRARLRLGDRTFGLGDAVSVVDANGAAVPPSAQTALDQADVAATNIDRLAAHYRNGARGFEPKLDPYRYDSAGWVVSVGDGTVAMVGPTVLTGAPARALKAGVSARYDRALGRARSGHAKRLPP